MKSKNIFIISALAGVSMPVMAQQDSLYVDFVNQSVEIGADLAVPRKESTASVSVISNADLDRRSAKNIGNALVGNGQGLITLQGAGTSWAQNPTMYIRGLQSLNGDNNPLFIVDGIERDITMIDPEEVQEVQILKDAAATALFGYKGSKGVVYIKTKRGQYNSKTIRFTYEHTFQNLTNKPRFIDGPTYASAMNEALANEGQGPFARYSQQELDAFASGKYPSLYPNVDWVNETFRNHAAGNKAAIEFSGGGNRFRYFTLGTLFVNDGYIKNPNETKGYSTQDKYVRGNVRTNLDIDLTPSTMLHTDVLASLSEMSCPGAQTDMWGLVHSVPSAAFPVRTESGMWGGNSTWSGTLNPVAQAQGAAYSKVHERALYFNATLDQDLSMVIPGLKFFIGASYDTWSNLVENHSKEYLYGGYPVSGWVNGEPVMGDLWTGGKQGEMSADANTEAYKRRFTANGGFKYGHAFGEHSVNAMLKYDYEFEDQTGINNKIYRRNFSFWGQYAYANRYMLGVSLVESGSSRLAPGTKWAFSPTVSAGAIIVENPDAPAINFLKLRGSFGVLNSDVLPGDNVWTYYTQAYTTSGGSYPFPSDYATDKQGNTTLGQMATANPSNEKVRKFDVGIDASLFNCIDVELDYFFNHRYNIWVDGSGSFSSVIGYTAPYINGGAVDNQGIDLSVNFTKSYGEWTFLAGGSFLWSKSKIKDMAEEPRAFANLVQTGNPVNSTYGLIAEGLFTSDEEIANSPTQTFSTVRKGDIKYRDVNKDGVIDANDATKIGHSTYCPEIYYTFHLGAEYKNVGISAHFQGTGNYSGLLNSTYYWGLISNRSLGQEVYDGRWTPETNDANAEFPRLSSTSNANNYITSTYWLRDRSFLKLRNLEVYYNMPQSLLAKTKFIKGARLYVRGVDLFTLDHIDHKDAECLGTNTPLSRNVVLGAKLTF